MKKVEPRKQEPSPSHDTQIQLPSPVATESTASTPSANEEPEAHRPVHSNAGKNWTKEHDDMVWNEYYNTPIEELSVKLGRSKSAIRQRFYYLKKKHAEADIADLIAQIMRISLAENIGIEIKIVTKP